MKKLSILVFAALICFCVASADIYMKQKIHTDAFEMMGQNTPAKDEVNHIWMGKNKMAQIGNVMSFVVNMDKKEVLWINHENKSYIAMSIPFDLSTIFPAQILQMMGDVNIKINETGQSEMLEDRKCDIYEMTIEMSSGMMPMQMKQKIWATTDVPFDWKKYMEDMYAQVARLTMRLSEDALKEWSKIKGYQIKMEMTMSIMGQDMKTVQEIVEIDKKSPPAGTYSVPEGYTKKEKLSFSDFQNR